MPQVFKPCMNNTQNYLPRTSQWWSSIFIYIRNVIHGDFGYSISQYPRTVADVIKSSIWWTVALQFPAIIVGWILGNTLGALAAYLRKGFDKVLLPVSIFLSSLPAFGMAIVLLVVFAVNLKWFPTSGGYAYDMVPSSELGIRMVGHCSLSTAILVDCVDYHRRPGDRDAFNGDL